jgi:hypothetical protein
MLLNPLERGDEPNAARSGGCAAVEGARPHTGIAPGRTSSFGSGGSVVFVWRGGEMMSIGWRQQIVLEHAVG